MKSKALKKTYTHIEHVKKLVSFTTKEIKQKFTWISNNEATKLFKKALKVIGVEEKRRIYSLRHTHCSYLISKDIPIEYISKRLVHSPINMTLEF